MQDRSRFVHSTKLTSLSLKRKNCIKINNIKSKIDIAISIVRVLRVQPRDTNYVNISGI